MVTRAYPRGFRRDALRSMSEEFAKLASGRPRVVADLGRIARFTLVAIVATADGVRIVINWGDT